MKTQLAVGVRELVEHVLRGGDLKVEFTGASRAADAIRLHQRVQAERPPGYAPEVAVCRRVDRPEAALAVGGRIDGVFTELEIPVIEEIKTTRRSPLECLREENRLHWGQAKIYAFIYAAEHGLAEVGVQLTYVRVDTGESRETRRHFPVAELAAFFDDVVGRYLEWAARVIAWQRQRDASIRGLSFPFDTYRPGQQEMAAAVAQCLERGERLFIQAATGIGKTLAVLFPSLARLADGTCRTLFYLTARTTGRLAAEKAVAALRTRGLHLKSLTLTAKEKSCVSPGAACLPEECAVARGHYDRLPDARRAIFASEAWTRAAVAEVASRFQVCPFDFALDLSQWADLVVCDYNHAFDPTAYLRRFFQEGSGDSIFLVDEAHNLVDRAREMFSAALHKTPFLDLRRSVKGALPAVHRQLGRINTWMLAARRRVEASAAPIADAEAPEALYPLLREFMAAADAWLEKNLAAPFRQALLERYFEAGGFLRTAERFDAGYAACFEASGEELRVKLFCIDPSRQLGEALHRCRAAVFFSATLSPLDYFQTLLASESAAALTLPSPFPAENLAVFVADRLSTYYRHRERTAPEVARILGRLVQPHRGNYLLFFPSYRYMQMVLKAFQAATPEIDIVVQEPGMGEEERERFLERFAADTPRTLAGFAVMGGIFGEGIDLVGTRLAGAAIVGVGLPAVGLERELIRAYFAERLERGFEYAYMYPGLNRVLQAAGRVIRTETDRGVVLLIDQRYGSPHYRRLLPESWRPVSIRDAGRFEVPLRAFWSHNGDGSC